MKKSSKLVCTIVCALAMSTAVLASATGDALAQSTEPDQQATDKLAACDNYMGAYARSSARKLARSLSGQKYSFHKLPEKTSLEVKPAGREEARNFELLFEKDHTAAGVVDKARDHRTTYVLVHYELGPVVAVHHWPSRNDVASGAKTCAPTSSSIAFPDVPVAVVDVDPFKFWGLRVMWHIPTDLPDAVITQEPLDALRGVIAATN